MLNFATLPQIWDRIRCFFLHRKLESACMEHAVFYFRTIKAKPATIATSAIINPESSQSNTQGRNLLTTYEVPMRIRTIPAMTAAVDLLLG